MNPDALKLSQTPVASPCNAVCRMDPFSGLCLGCSRTLDEIAGWSRMTDTDRQRIVDQLPQRTPAAKEPRP
jgi:predicted Fe-S protein YdhL (DUF1289 family)